jgi:pimeloyl-ACP methyl ester carboxylesterase
MRHPDAVDKLAILNAPHPQRFLESLRGFSQWRKSWYILWFQLPWLPERLFRAGGYAGLERILRHDPVRPGAFDADAIAAYKQAIDQPGALTAALNYYRALFRCNPLNVKRSVRRIDAPTLLVWGKQDRYLDPRLADGLEPWVPNLQVRRIADAGHWIQAEAPERANALLLAFLRGA